MATKSTVSATKLDVLATKSTATRCRIHAVADLLQNPATKLNVYGNSRLCCRFVASFSNSRLSTKSTVLNSTLSPVCTGLARNPLIRPVFTKTFSWSGFADMYMYQYHLKWNVFKFLTCWHFQLSLMLSALRLYSTIVWLIDIVMTMKNISLLSQACIILQAHTHTHTHLHTPSKYLHDLKAVRTTTLADRAKLLPKRFYWLLA